MRKIPLLALLVWRTYNLGVWRAALLSLLVERLLLAGLIILANRIEGGLVSSGSGAGSIGCAPSHGVVGSLIELLELLVHLLRVLLQRHWEHVRLLLLLAHILHILILHIR